MNFKKYHVSKNLFDISFTKDDYATNVYHWALSGLTPNAKYTCSSNFVQSGTTASIWFGGTSSRANGVSNNDPKTMTANANGVIDIYMNHSSNGAYDQIVGGTTWVMVNTGSTPLPYEPYSSEVWHDTPHYIHNTSTDTITTLPAVIHPTGTTATVGLKGNTLQSSIPSPTSPVMPQGTGDLETSGTKAGQYKIPISSASTTTPVYLGEVESTRKVKKLVLTGNETVAGSAVTGGWIITNLSDYINNSAGVQTAYCSHYLAKNNGAMSSLSQGEMCISTQVNNRINFVTNFATAVDFESYLQQQYAAGTPVTVWYVLATETTGIVNEPLHKIGDYADEVSGITIPVTAGANTLSVDTTLQPSEVSVNYQGWHPVQSVHERENGQWD